ncbi:Cl- channel voltage-gated family protein [Pseudonocardia sp. CNS-004]|nr:Cl- channel voltage-gated family protein [Pseudonocardia sp. CNS-004]
MADEAGAAPPVDATEQLRSPAYARLLVFAAVIGAPVSAVAYYFLQLAEALYHWVHLELPHVLGFATTPLWWPLPVLGLAGVLVGLTIRHLPGRGGHSALDGFAHGAPTLVELPGILLTALASLGAGAVLGPEAPLVALGAGLAVLAVRFARRDVPAPAAAVVAAAGSFAAISAILGSPLLGAFLLMEAAVLGGPMLGVVLLPGLLAAGIGSLIFIGLNRLTGLEPVALALPHLPPFERPDVAQFAWALVIGAIAAVLGSGIRWIASRLQPHVERRTVLLTAAAGLAVAGLTIAYAVVTARDPGDVLGSGQETLGPLLQHGAGYPLGALLMLVVCKGLAYSLSLSCFRGGPVFPAMFVGAAGGIALSHLPGLPMVAGVAMGMGAMCVVMLKLPLTSVLLATLLMFENGVTVMPLVIVAVVVAHVMSARLTGPEAAIG